MGRIGPPPERVVGELGKKGGRKGGIVETVGLDQAVEALVLLSPELFIQCYRIGMMPEERSPSNHHDLAFRG